ncbi:MAG: methionyl-tRNA formyltransferase [Lachnospiraceae bacterium]|nr:methionyl-tRNA formyltransferase [Lachnospiraceae bacterium]
MKILFMGTPDYAAEALEALIQAGHEIVAAVTQPDKPKGRSKELQPPPVKVCAVKHGVPVMQPKRIKTPEAIAALRQYDVDVYVVAAFGQILSQEILDIPPYGSLNIHASLLPKYRGASPIQHVILAGEEKTGITIMQMDAGIDTGDMLYQMEIAISPEDTFETLHDKLAALGGKAITQALSLLEEGKLTPQKQKEELSCYAPLIGKEMGRIDFSLHAWAIERQIRAMTPWPSAFTSYQGKQLKVWKAAPAIGENTFAGKPGEVIGVDKNSIIVSTGKGALCIEEVQLEGKKRMSVHDFLLGVKVMPGQILG